MCQQNPSSDDAALWAELRYQRTQLEYARYEATSHMSDRIQARIAALKNQLNHHD